MERIDTDALLTRLLATRGRDEEALYAVHRELLAVDPELYRRLVGWLKARVEDERHHLVAALAILSLDEDVNHRALAGRIIESLPVELVCDVVDHVRGWVVERLHAKAGLSRYTDEMSQTYAATSAAVRAELAEHNLPELDGGEVIVTLGQFDKVEQVLDYLEVPYRLVPCGIVKDLPLRADQVLIVNCPGQFDEEGIKTIERFVFHGGTLITTDWALKTTIQRAFPGTVAHNGVNTGDDVVSVSWIHPDDVHTRGVEVSGYALAWWLEGSSYPIEVLDPRRVNVLVRSKEMHQKYGADPLVVSFVHGEGVVFHLTSHYYLQRSKAEQKTKEAAASSSLRLLGNILFERRRLTGV